MRLCHLADTHLGAGENHPRRAPDGLTERQHDIIRTFTEAIDKIIDLKPDLCIHAGDLFHSVRPTNRIMAVAARQLHRLAQTAEIPTLIITGNHDAPKQSGHGPALDVFRTIDNLHVIADSHMEHVTIAGASVTALPHCLTTDIQKAELDRCRPDPHAPFNILVMHGVAAGMEEFSMVELGEQELPLAIMDGFDYVALGHFHNFRKVADRAWYSGSTERLSQSERDADKGFIEVNLADSNITFHKVASRIMIDVPEIDATGLRGDEIVNVVRKRVTELGGEDKIMRVRLTNVSEEARKTIPTEELQHLRQQSYALDIQIQRPQSKTNQQPTLGRAGIGRLDKAFLEFLEQQSLEGFDLDRLKSSALRYLTQDDQ
jgi:DNA repair protein SbcD/Mre11